MPQINYNNKLSNIPSSFRVQAIQQLHAEGTKQPTIGQITSRVLKLYTPIVARKDIDAIDDDCWNACPDVPPKGFRS